MYLFTVRMSFEHVHQKQCLAIIFYRNTIHWSPCTSACIIRFSGSINRPMSSII